MVKEYKCYIGGIDLQDMLFAGYRSNARVQYYLRTVLHLLNRCVAKCAASVLSPLLTARKYQVQDYRVSVRDNTRSSQGRGNKYEEKGPVGKR